MSRIPGGRTSSVKTLNRTFILQTEFREIPKPVIVTSVSLDGQVAHRVERSYPQPIETDKDFDAVEVAIRAQHNGLAKKIMASGADFIRKTRAIKISRSDRLGVIPGVSYVVNIEEKLASDNPLTVYAQSKIIMEIADAISSSSRIGPFEAAAIISGQGKYILDKYEGQGYMLSLKSDADIGRILNEIKEG